MRSLTFGLFTQVSDSGPQGPLVNFHPFKFGVFFYYAPEGTSGGILKSNRPSVRLSVTNPVSAISHKLLKQI